MSAHTPGPWIARKSRGLNSYELRGDNDSAYIADVWGAETPVPNGVAVGAVKANARLIAAAPEMLDALKAVEWNGHGMARCPMCFGWDTNDGGEGDKRHSKDCKLAAAIAKAEGRA